MRTLTLISLLAACGGARLPPPEPYDPNPTPEPETSCPEERKAAKAAREAAIGAEATAPREKAAAAVFAHGECERLAFDRMALDEAEFGEAVRALKAQAYSVQNLYQESVSYDIPLYAVGGNARTGDLYAAYAKKLRTADPGPGVTDAATRAMWFSEMDELARQVEAEGAKYWARALDVAEMGPEAFRDEPEVAGWIRASCRGLQAVDPQALAGRGECSR